MLSLPSQLQYNIYYVYTMIMWVGEKLLEKAEKYVEKKLEQKAPGVVTQVDGFSQSQNLNGNEKVAEKKENNDQLHEDEDVKNVLQETKANLESLRNSVVLPADQEKTKEYIQWLLTSIKTLDVYDKTLIWEIEKTLTDKNYDNKKAIEQMIAVIGDLEKKSEQLSEADKEKLLDQKAGMRSASLLLGELRKTISIDPEKALHDAKEQAFLELTNELKTKWRCPNWLADKIYTLLVDKYINKKEENIGQKLLSWLAVTILSLAMGKHRKDFFDNIDNLWFDHIKNILWKAADKWKSVRESIKTGTIGSDMQQKKEEAVEKGKELTQQEIQKAEVSFKNMIAKTVENINGKKITKEQIDRVFKKITIAENTENIKKIYRYLLWKGQQLGENGNYTLSVLEGLSLPFTFGRQIFNTLVEEGIISFKDIVFEVWDGVIWYGLKWFKLFGVWASAVIWKISWKEMGEQLGVMYNKAPNQAKVVLASLIYRTQQNPIFNAMLNIAEQATYILTTALVDWPDKINTLYKNVTDVYNNKISTALWNIDELLAHIPDSEGVVNTVKKSVLEMKEISKLIEKKLPSNMKWADFKAFVESTGAKFDDLPKWIKDLAKESGVIDKAKLRTTIATEIPWICGKANIVKWQRWIFKTLMRDTKWFFYWEANPYRVADEAAKYLDDIGKYYSKILGGGLWKSSISKLQLSRKLVGWFHNGEKAAFYARDVESAEDMIKQMKFLAKESPSTLKFLIGKTPLFLVWWMAFEKDGTPTEKMKSLLWDMMWLVPVVWPLMILIDSTYVGKVNVAQMTAWGVLLAADVYYLINAWVKSGSAWILKYVTQPVVDLYEVGKFWLDGFRRWWTLLKNTVSLAWKEWFRAWLKWVWKSLFTGRRVGKMALAFWLVTTGYFTYEYFFWEKIDDETQAKLDEYKKDPNKLDREVLAQWPSLDQEEKNDYLKAALLARGWFSAESLGDLDVKYDTTKKSYLVQLPEVLNGDQKDLLKETLTNALSDLQPDASVSMQLAPRAIVEYRNKLNELYKDKLEPDKTRLKKEYIQTMWYDADAILSA